MSTIDRLAIRRVAVERATVISGQSFDAVLAKLAAAVGHPDMSAFARDVVPAGTSADLERIVEAATGPAASWKWHTSTSEMCSGRSWATAPRRACAPSSAIR